MDFSLTSYTIRRKFFKLFGASFRVLDPNDKVVAFSKQQAFRLKEDIRVYSDETMRETILTIQSRQIIDFSAAYDVVAAREQRKVGALRRKGWSSLLRDSWELLDENDRLIGKISEDSKVRALLRRLLSNLIPQTFHLHDTSGRSGATFRVHFNPFLYRMTVSRNEGSATDARLVFAAAVLLCAIEGRQK
jgi:hypothetical protein